MLLNPSEQRHLQLIDEGLTRFLTAEAREVDDGNPGLTVGTVEKPSGIKFRAFASKQGICRNRSSKLICDLGSQLEGSVDLANAVRKICYEINEIIEGIGALFREIA